MRRAYIHGVNKIEDAASERVRLYFSGWVTDTDGGTSFEFGVPADVNYSVTFPNDMRLSEMGIRAGNQLRNILNVTRRNLLFLEW